MAKFYNLIESKDHDIMFDRARWGNYPRYTCLTCDETLIKRPYDNSRDWIKRLRNWLEIHPNAELKEKLK